MSGGMVSGPFGYFNQPLRTRERAAVDVARAGLRKIALLERGSDSEAARQLAGNVLSRMSVILGEREKR